MFSFLSKKKPDATPVTVIQGPADPQQQNNGADDFIFIERKPTDEPKDNRSMYPPMPPAPSYPSGLVYPPYTGTGGNSYKNLDNTPASYLQDVPFALSPQLCTKNDFDVTQMQVDGMLAMMTRQMSVDAQEEYNFALERSIQEE